MDSCYILLHSKWHSKAIGNAEIEAFLTHLGLIYPVERTPMFRLASFSPFPLKSKMILQAHHQLLAVFFIYPVVMPKLFAVYLGGLAKSSHIEVHDVRFVTGNTIEDTFSSLRQEWFGIPKGLHIDVYMEITEVDGFSITLHPYLSAALERLYFVNTGG